MASLRCTQVTHAHYVCRKLGKQQTVKLCILPLSTGQNTEVSRLPRSRKYLTAPSLSEHWMFNRDDTDATVQFRPLKVSCYGCDFSTSCGLGLLLPHIGRKKGALFWTGSEQCCISTTKHRPRLWTKCYAIFIGYISPLWLIFTC